MTNFLTTLQDIAVTQPTALALVDNQKQYTWAQMLHAAEKMAAELTPYSGKVVALHADNSVDWVIVDLACIHADVALLPLPAFFSRQQLEHAINTSQPAALITDEASTLPEQLGIVAIGSQSLTTSLALRPLAKTGPAALPAGTRKITYTSGSTGHPKGVCLSFDNQLTVAKALLERTGLQGIRHLCVLPLTTLLENIAGIYAPLLSGGQIHLQPAEQMGFNGGGGFDVKRFLLTLSEQQPQSLILLPELLLALIVAVDQGWQPPSSLQFIAVGGSRVSPALIARARQAGLPVYEGYGLSECSSVVSLNSPGQDVDGTVGKPLPHVSVEIEDGEIVVKGNAFLGYINEPETWAAQKIYTGDLGYVDDAGYLHIEGRKKNLLISSFGRNINPEWVESELLSNPMLQKCVVVGDAKPFCSALIEPRNADIPDEFIDNWIERVNETLPDYARIRHWQRFAEPLSQATGTLTANGRPVRQKIYQLYQYQIEDFYKETV